MLESLNLTDLVIAGLAVARITSLIVTDDITEPVRHQIFKRSPPPAYVTAGIVQGRSAGMIGTLLSCTHCVGIWVAGFTAAVAHYKFDSAIPVLTIAAIAQISDTAIKLSR